MSMHKFGDLFMRKNLMYHTSPVPEYHISSGFFDQICSQISLISIEKWGGGGDIGADSCLSAWVESLEFEIGAHKEIDKLCVSSCSCSTCINIGSNVVDFLAILFDHNWSTCSTSISSKDDSISVLAADDSGACFFMRSWVDDVFILEHLISEWKKSYLWVSAKSKPPICWEYAWRCAII